MKFSAGTGAKAVLQTAITLIAAVLLTTWLTVWNREWIRTAGMGVIGACWGLCFFWLFPRFTRSVYGVFENNHIRLSCGVLLHRDVFVPLSALRTFEIWAPPLHRLFSCRTVVLRFAGGAAVLPLLDCRTAAALTEKLDRSEEAS